MNRTLKANCFSCGKEGLSMDTIGINKKLLGKNVKTIYCMKCLAEYLGTTTQDLVDKIDEFKEEGCMLFQ